MAKNYAVSGGCPGRPPWFLIRPPDTTFAECTRMRLKPEHDSGERRQFIPMTIDKRHSIQLRGSVAMILFSLTAANFGCAQSNSSEAGVASAAPAQSAPTSIPQGTRAFATDALIYN